MKKSRSFGQYVTRARQQHGYSERQLATVVHVANTTIIRIENGSVPQPGLFVALVDALDLDIITAVHLIEPYRQLYERIVAAQKDTDDGGTGT